MLKDVHIILTEWWGNYTWDYIYNPFEYILKSDITVVFKMEIIPFKKIKIYDNFF